MIEHGDFTCVECGIENPTISYFEPVRSRLIERKMCFSCDFWTEALALYEDPEYFVSDGHLYKDGGLHDAARRPRWAPLGFSGRMFEAHCSDGRVVKTNNLWHCGQVPAHFRNRFPDNAKFSKGEKWHDCGGQEAFG